MPCVTMIRERHDLHGHVDDLKQRRFFSRGQSVHEGRLFAPTRFFPGHAADKKGKR